MTTVSEASALIDRHIRPWPGETVSLDHAAGRVLAEDVRAERDIPAFDRVTMDGIAIAAAAVAGGTREFLIDGMQPAGAPGIALGGATHCIRVMTGAVLPAGADSVVPIERVAIDGAIARIDPAADIRAGQFVHSQGSDRLRDSVVLKSGTVLAAPEIAVLASVGKARLAVRRLPAIAVISTGDELVGVDEPLAPHQIRSSNGRAIEAALCRHNCAEVSRHRLRDEPGSLLQALEALHGVSDALILSGGVSMGEFDFVPGALQHLGARVIFHRIDQKPGRPMWFGISGQDKPIFALPGNPVSTLVCMARYVVPALRSALGDTPQPEYASLTHPMPDGPSDWTWFVPVTLSSRPDGSAHAQPHSINTSGDFSSLAGTDGIAELGTADGERARGAVVRVYRW